MRLKYITIIAFLLVSLAFAGTVFIEYSATPGNNKVTITWRTGSESGVDQFQIQRSTDDNVFIEIGIVDKNTNSVYGRRHDKRLRKILKLLKKFKEKLQGTIVESTWNWYWFVDRLQNYAMVSI